MTDRFELLIRNVRDSHGTLIGVGISGGRIAAIGQDIVGKGPEYDGRGQTVGPGLHDHHVHLLATAARLGSVDLSESRTREEVRAKLQSAPIEPGAWVRAIGYDERSAGIPDRCLLDEWLPDQPLRIQDRTGRYWVLNSEGVARLGTAPFPLCVERDADGVPNGRIRRGDAWLRGQIGGVPPSLTTLGAQYAGWGVTGVTDAGASNGPAEADLLSGAIPQRLILMGTEELTEGDGYRTGPVKLLLDEDRLPPVEMVAARIQTARLKGKNVAAHCVTLAELVFYLEALAQSGGARSGDRIEHGAVIPQSLISDISAAGLTVVTQPNFIHDRGDRYCAQLHAIELGDLYRLGSLRRGGVRVLGGSDAPYGDPNPWVALRAATNRRTRGGQIIGPEEVVSRPAALALYQRETLHVGSSADLILYDWPDDHDALATVGLALIGGNIVWQA